MILDAKHMIDSVGHYARPDVTKLIVNREQNSALQMEEVIGMREQVKTEHEESLEEELDNKE